MERRDRSLRAAEDAGSIVEEVEEEEVEDEVGSLSGSHGSVWGPALAVSPTPRESPRPTESAPPQPGEDGAGGRQRSPAGGEEAEQEVEEELRAGERVAVSGVYAGTLRFHGATAFATGRWAGVELDEAEGTGDGSCRGVRYFRCPDGHGVFAPADRVRRLRDGADDDVRDEPPREGGRARGRRGVVLAGSPAGGGPPSSSLGQTSGGKSVASRREERELQADAVAGDILGEMVGATVSECWRLRAARERRLRPPDTRDEVGGDEVGGDEGGWTSSDSEGSLEALAREPVKRCRRAPGHDGGAVVEMVERPASPVFGASRADESAGGRSPHEPSPSSRHQPGRDAGPGEDGEDGDGRGEDEFPAGKHRQHRRQQRPPQEGGEQQQQRRSFVPHNLTDVQKLVHAAVQARWTPGGAAVTTGTGTTITGTTITGAAVATGTGTTGTGAAGEECGELKSESDIEVASKAAYTRAVQDLVGEVYDKLVGRDSNSSLEPWGPGSAVRRTRKTHSFNDVTELVQQEVARLLGLDPRGGGEGRTDSPLRVPRLRRRHRDRVDLILTNELQQEERGWVDYRAEERRVKLQLADGVLDALLADTAALLGTLATARRRRTPRAADGASAP
ncbi:uncharacterized protein LOC144736544 [Lampetra planeri]